MIQPTIKKYRRIVPEDTVQRIAAETENHPVTVRAILEAYAEVIEVLNYEEYQSLVEPDKTMVQVNYAVMSKEQFHAEWEEIE